jgi:hypothetical protein
MRARRTDHDGRLPRGLRGRRGLPIDPERVARLVRREAEEECRDGRFRALALERRVRDAVAALRGSRITAFVPLLALREVRCCLRAGSCDRGGD